ARPWSRSGGNRFRLASRIAAAVAIIAIAASGAYLYESGRASSPGQGTMSPSGSPTAAASATSTPGASPSPTNTPPNARVTQLPGSSWRLVSGAFPRMVAPAFSRFWPTVFALTGGSGGFVAFVPSLAAFTTAGPTSPTSWVTRVYQSIDGVDWTEQAPLPSDAASVSAVADSGGRIVAVGWTGETPNDTAMTWTTTDLLTWHATRLPVPAQSDTRSEVFGVATGPAGFLAYGYAGNTSEFWISADGLSWSMLTTSGLPAEPLIDDLYGNSEGWEIRGSLFDRSATWQSNRDGSVWKQTWTGPGPSGMEGYALGPLLKAPGGGFLSFGSAYMAPGGQAVTPYDMLIWTSGDGLSWTKSDRVKSPGWTSGFASLPGGYVAAGSQPSAPWLESWGPLGVWTSRDGRAWQALPSLPATGRIQVLTVVGDGAHVVVVCVDEQGHLQLLVGDGLQ
ncbi:MAG TPA: hypothetical protein VF371_07945, partial [Candidatus Limnocylindrales bacterium]